MEQWQVVTPHTCILGEGPVWDSSQNRILWVDIKRGHIHQYLLEKRELRIFESGELTGAIGLRGKGGLIAALQNGFALIDPDRGTIEKLVDPESHIPENRFNDAKCDPTGRFWAGTMSVHDTPAAGSLYALEPNFTVVIKRQKLTCSNGMAWNADGSIMYHIDTPTRQVMAFDYDLITGSIANGRVVIEIPGEDGLPDGLTIDADGMLWIALWDGWKIVRYNPETGKRIHEISLPVSHVTSCTFGGNKLQDLYITTARDGLSEAELEKQPLAGCLFVVKDSGFTGLPADEFKG